jgi:hypothetical protein
VNYAILLTNIHVVGVATLCWHYGNYRACFEQKIIKSPMKFICYAFLKFREEIQKESDKKIITLGEEALQATAMEEHMRASANDRLQITNLDECDDNS